MAMQQIIPKLYTFTGLIAGRVYLIEDPDGLTLIDAGLPLAAKRILKQLKAAGHAPEAVKRILVTHAHIDHVGGLPALQTATGAKVIASTLERPVIEGEIPIPRRTGFPRPPDQTLPGATVNRTVVDGDVIEEAMGGLEVIFTPGHAPGHIAFWQPNQQVLFCGDAITRWRNLGLPPVMGTVDMADSKQSIRRLAKLNSKIVCFGHGKPLTENAAEAIRVFTRTLGAG